MATMQRARATLKIQKRNTASVTGRAKSVRDGLSANSGKFAAPNPTPAAIDAQVTVVDKAETVARTRAAGSASARNVERTKLVGMLEVALTYVQQIADASPSYDEAVATIEAAGLKLAIVPQRTKQILTVRRGPEPGSVILEAFARALGISRTKRSFLSWQATSDGGASFVTLPSTTKVKTTVTGLKLLSTYGFRVSVTNSEGVTGEWSQVVSFLVQ